ncbi:MAG TPA: molecular chaperone HtpG [Thermosynechococcus sp. M3746_W2019_013]|uniref:molecular chaperone HtpG n=1 Tax=Thermosynechococcus sp. M3746_W2019_013 TaxID=2747806 RepID=UPI0019DFE6E3|nr:molecular chaperone HtpG [Thermosynechococcus sp. M3746_W2019_013]HIK23539.1 molecular chaperone HtpG [Thermosynechococcus sp. M3746_W2019_013]
MLEQGTISIHTENIFPIIKKWLYSDHEIFLRELVSNAVDAIQKLRMVARSGEYSGDVDHPEVTITIDKENKKLAIADNGIGMTAEEVKKYITQVAFSSAEEFVQKYKGEGENAIIGHFGLGFYSAFMVAERVEIDTLSYREGAVPVHWTCDGSTEFTLSDGQRTTVGTTVTLTLQDSELEYLEPARIRELVRKYCDFLPVPIKLEGEQINKQIAPWKSAPNSLSKEDYLEFYRYLYPFQEDPLLWVHLNTDYPFVVNGILYFPKLRPDIDVTKGQIKLYCNQVFVSDSCEEIIPRFLLPLRGVIDSSDIPLNVSRSFLQNDRTVRKIADYIAKKVGDRLKELYREDPAAYVRLWQDLGTFVKFGSINDEKFKKQVEDILIYRTTAELTSKDSDDVWAAEGGIQVDGKTYTTLKQYLERNKERQGNRVYYCTDEVNQATYVQLLKSQGIEVLFMDSFIDTHFVPWLEQNYSNVKFLRVDAELDETLIDKSKESELIDPTTNKTRSEQIKALFESVLKKPKLTIRTEALKADAPPAMILLPEASRRMQEMMAMMQQQANAQLPEEHILVVNTAHPLVQNLLSLNQGTIIQTSGTSETGTLVEKLCQYIYDLALMSQRAFDANGMQQFTERASQVLTQLTAMATR